MSEKTQKAGRGRSRPPVRTDAGDSVSLEEPELNMRIVELLQQDGRMPYSSIASIVGVSEGTVRNRVKQLIADNVITIQAEALPDAFGYKFNTMTFINVAAGADVDAVARRLAQLPDVYYLTMLLGRFDLGMATYHKSQEDFREFLIRHCYGHPDIAEVENSLVLKVHKVKLHWSLDDDARRGPASS
ncbi:Lrp/AsnC family transcriptional regulator [Sphingosinicella terrae]|jgi:Lrp/AsnC family transcriptional regulator, regulator for asnA, asnC and gidA|uniref:Lrp/AsnC family transcriptional regulator n=1 Tax=Sphingosinicella terrae TaxID=2172047 RepID=UPI000E0DE951|nr:Lrp/AsnC family transcriptional regulator [Sphingosinicella terrae]